MVCSFFYIYACHEDFQEAEEEGADSGAVERARLGDPDPAAGGVAPAFQACQQGRRAIISDPFFIQSHLQLSASKWEQKPSLLITPHCLDRFIEGENWPTTFSSSIFFYRWQQGASEARLVHGRDLAGEFSSVCYFAHCDGLVLVPTDTNVYVFNPATRDVVTLPESSRNVLPGRVNLSVGFGRDPRTGMYKVVRSFFRPRDRKTGIFNMGMEVCTLGGGGRRHCWRETAADPPYPVEAWVTAQSVKGAVYWTIDISHLKPRPHSLLRFGLEDEAFRMTNLPDSLATGDGVFFNLNVMRGELCLTDNPVGEPDDHPVMIWILVEDNGPRSVWEPRYKLNLTVPCQPLSILPDGAVLISLFDKLQRYDPQSKELTLVCELDSLRFRRATRSRRPGFKNLHFFNVIPYTESLIPLIVRSS